MSASLVGSEMCIRDSRATAFQLLEGLHLLRPSVAMRPRGPPLRREAFQAVSYTHLTLPTICSV
eukprot:8517341-Alexandrium_andersonii.AAC.1